MSISEDNDFLTWLRDLVRSHGEFTALVILTEIQGTRVVPLASTFLHVIGDDLRWADMAAMLAGSGHDWDGVAFFPTQAPDGGPCDTPTAQHRLRELETKVRENRMVLNDGLFVDTFGRHIKIEPVANA